MELQNHKAEFDAAGIKLFAISYDQPDALKRFADKYGIEYPLLSDAPDSKTIREYGILNTLVRPEETEHYGMPFPGSYLVGEDGKVVAKYFNRPYQERLTAPALLHNGFGLPVDPSVLSHAQAGSGQVRVSADLLTTELHRAQRSFIYVTLDLDPGLHIYGPDIVDDYVPTTIRASGPEGISFGEPQWPSQSTFRMEDLDDEFSGYEGTVEVVVPVLSMVREETTAEIAIEVGYQACNDTMCFLPKTEKLTLEVATAPNVGTAEP